MDAYYVGLMSGTSLDAIDAALIRIDNGGNLEVVSLLKTRFPDHIPPLLRSLISGNTESLHTLCKLNSELGEVYANAVLELLSKSAFKTQDISAIGSHGQTIRHQPDSRHPYSLQIGNPSVIAEKTGVTTVADFRSRDIAAGGQGAPLVPAFHNSVFSDPEHKRVIVNLGGIANITFLPALTSGKSASGYDTGPANCLLDAWSMSCRGVNYDERGSWAASGEVDIKLLDALLTDSYFSKSPPKSTGSEYFNLDWLESTYPPVTDLNAVDVQTSLAELSAHTVALSIIREDFDADEIYLCGGGVHNQDLTARLHRHLPKAQLFTTEKLGLDPDYVEATAFAWLAWCTMENRAGNLPAVTGARHPVVLGGIYPA